MDSEIAQLRWKSVVGMQVTVYRSSDMAERGGLAVIYTWFQILAPIFTNCINPGQIA